MADLSKIKLNGTEYDLKDAIARAGLVTAEADANVTAMLTNYGLNAAANLSAATVGNSSTGSAVVQTDPPAQA